MLIKHSLGLILINLLETCTSVSKRSHNMLWMICSTFSTLNLPPSLFCSNKNKFEVLHLFDLINDVQFPLLLCLSLQLELVHLDVLSLRPQTNTTSACAARYSPLARLVSGLRPSRWGPSGWTNWNQRNILTCSIFLIVFLLATLYCYCLPWSVGLIKS